MQLSRDPLDGGRFRPSENNANRYVKLGLVHLTLCAPFVGAVSEKSVEFQY